MLFLGMDGGGTKTAFTLIDGECRVAAEFETSGSYYPEIGIANLRALVEHGVRAVSAKADVTPDAIDFGFFGIPAYGEDVALIPELQEVPRSVLPRGNFRCDNDVVCAWAGSLACHDGISIVAGTGSIGYGRCNGQSARCGGWGEVFGDEGSAYWIAVRGLQAFSKMSDGRTPKGPLYDEIRDSFGLIQDLDLSARIIDLSRSDRSGIASVSRHIADAAGAGDELAIGLFVEAADELAQMVMAIRHQLPFPTARVVRVSFSGGVFGAADLIMNPLRSALSAGAMEFDIQEPEYSPQQGAALYAGVLANCSSIVKRLGKSPER